MISWCDLIFDWWGNWGSNRKSDMTFPSLENPMNGGAWKAAIHGTAESRTRPSNFTFIFHFRALEKEMATHSSVLAWRIPGTGEPGGLPSMGSHRVRHDWSDPAAGRTETLMAGEQNGLLFCFSLHCLSLLKHHAPQFTSECSVRR